MVQGFPTAPKQDSYDVVIIGGAMMGSSVAWWLTRDPDFDGRVLVIERDPSFANCSTAHTNSCIRQQFSTALNIQLSQFTAQFLRDFSDWMDDARVPPMSIQNFGYMYLAETQTQADYLRRVHAVQVANGAGTRLMSPDEIAAEYPFYNLDGIVLGSHNTVDEGYWDGGGVFDWFRRKARDQGAEYIQAEVQGITRSRGRVEGVTLTDGRQITAGQIVNAAGPRAAQVAAMADINLPVEPRKRFTWVIEAETPLPRDLPLTIDPSGIHMRTDGPKTYMVGAAPPEDYAVDPTDFTMDHGMWLDRVWPTIATRIPAFETVRVVTEWAGHYAYNIIDQNAIVGPHPDLNNLIFLNGFSGHGLQQAPGLGRGVAELLIHGGFRRLDLSSMGFARLLSGKTDVEQAVI